MNETKDVLLSETLKYVGKIFKKDGVRTDKDGNEVKWKIWKLQFESGRQYPWQCSIFGNYTTDDKPLDCKGVHVQDMLEGKFYEAVYKIQEYTHAEHGVVKSKQVVLIKESEEANSTQNVMGQNNNNQDTTPSTQQPLTGPVPGAKVSADNFVGFATEYKEAVQGEGNSLHMLGAYVLNKHAEEFKDVIVLCKKEFQ